MQLTSVILVGGGRMGKLIAQKLDADGGFAVEGIYDVDNADELDGRAPVVDLVIDFSNKAGLPHGLAYVERTGAALVSGTTGFDDEELGRLRALGQKTRVIHSFNYSLGVAALKRACAQAALALGEWDCEHKSDEDAGTDRIRQTIAEAEGTREVHESADQREHDVHVLDHVPFLVLYVKPLGTKNRPSEGRARAQPRGPREPDAGRRGCRPRRSRAASRHQGRRG